MKTVKYKLVCEDLNTSLEFSSLNILKNYLASRPEVKNYKIYEINEKLLVECVA